MTPAYVFFQFILATEFTITFIMAGESKPLIARLYMLASRMGLSLLLVSRMGLSVLLLVCQMGLPVLVCQMGLVTSLGPNRAIWTREILGIVMN